MLTIINRGYCKKLLIILPGQKHPEQWHEKKEETFHVLHGSIVLNLDGKASAHSRGDIVTITPGVKHEFLSAEGAVIEEISTTHDPADSFYADPVINANRDRKTTLRYWK
jgi:quercetin dioxygenase-like cupin family protein